MNPEGYKCTCKNCHDTFIAPTARRKYCNDECRYEYNAKKPKPINHES